MKSNYRRFVISTNRLPDLNHAILGLCAEAGEVANIYKASLYKKKPLDKQALLLELSDVRWYLEACLIQMHYSIEQIEELNIQKLETRKRLANVPASSVEKRLEALISASHPHLMPERGAPMADVLSRLAVIIEDLQKGSK
jgi:hypothetical protein